MKKVLLAASLSVMASGCVQGYIPPPNLPASIQQVSTPMEARRWLEETLTYKRDINLYHQSDYWASCGQTYKNRGGDCEDYAICAAALLRDNVEDGYIVELYTPGKVEAHAIYVYQLHGRWGAISNQRMEYSQQKYLSIHELMLRINTLPSGDKRYGRYNLRSYEGVDLLNHQGDLDNVLPKKGDYSLDH